MKTIITLSVVLFSLNSFAKAPVFYAPTFEITKISPMCPSNLPTGAMCGGYGSIVYIKADIGCLDTLLFTETRTEVIATEINLHVVAVAEQSPDADRIRCQRPKTISKTIPVHEMGHITLINAEVRQ